MVEETELKIPYHPFPKQRIFHQCKAKFRALITGVGFGKTVAGANELLKMAILHPESVHIIIAPNTKILQNATLVEFRRFARPLIAGETKSRNLIHLINGATVLYLTADNHRHIERLRGLTIGSAWLDEAALFLPGVWDIIVARLRSNHGPLRIIITTTPKGFDWIYSLFVKKEFPGSHRKLPNGVDYEWFGGTTLDNPFTPEEFKQTLMHQYEGVFKKQEIYGEFCGFEGQVYKNFQYQAHVVEKAPDNLHEFVFGIDWGFTNALVGLIIGYDADGRKYVLEEFYEHGVQVDVLRDWLLNKKKEYNLAKGYADPSEPQFIIQFNRSGLFVMEADNEVMPGINAVYKELEPAADGKPRLYILARCQHTIEEFSKYRYKDAKDGVPQQENPLKVDDHAMDALRYVVKTHQFGSPGYALLDDPF